MHCHLSSQSMKLILAIGTGSFIGGILRYMLSEIIQLRNSTSFPIGTLTVNLLGCLFIGVIYGLAERSSLTEEWRLFLATGLLGGFTTFSAFSVETISLFRHGNFGIAIAYVAASILLGLIATIAGFTILKLF